MAVPMCGTVTPQPCQCDAQFICELDYNRQLPRCQQARGEAYSLPGKRFAPIAPARLVYLPGVGLAAFKKMIVIRT